MPSKNLWKGKFEFKHLEKLEVAFWENFERQDDCEYGSLGLDCKRPFGCRWRHP